MRQWTDLLFCRRAVRNRRGNGFFRWAGKDIILRKGVSSYRKEGTKQTHEKGVNMPKTVSPMNEDMLFGHSVSKSLEKNTPHIYLEKRDENYQKSSSPLHMLAHPSPDDPPGCANIICDRENPTSCQCRIT